MKLEGWKIFNKKDKSAAIVLVSKHYFKENVLSRFLDADFVNDEDLDIVNIKVDLPLTPAGG